MAFFQLKDTTNGPFERYRGSIKMHSRRRCRVVAVIKLDIKDPILRPQIYSTQSGILALLGQEIFAPKCIYRHYLIYQQQSFDVALSSTLPE